MYRVQPLIDRHRNAERIIDGEGDVQEIQAVDTEIVYEIAVRCNPLARHPTGQGNYLGDDIECRSHPNIP